MNVDECRSRFAAERHAYLATADRAAVPHLVPVTFAVVGSDEIAVAIDHKPKRVADPHRLRRIRNIVANPRVAFLADVYDEDWERLWWVRADASARVLDGGDERDRAVEELIERYPQYRAAPPAGPVLLARVDRWTGWSGRT
ncbi:TIGR03668 family PPOX class F420-dependent oxidoreductase [Actinotalea sp. M2MS4P-6]|uniref:TIGR03668 family PPOX class F420-dependent oxidoreductase n=1 Tax=Actinotalea sp. M2MS4P-6 TaxID=2983762 RepID=UPI0021E50A1A|nr:TIGR03668 family PPOX class F420-dependent oxidoreductase [Actinotalea sp. M2MS4P-6]MCV2394664.1 TIGR03668 family PPOX class F420-dependent oxidoreductase [Actinotalea sp. M2MS4P-6]